MNIRSSKVRRPASRSHSEEGSAYVISLLVLVLVTLMGLSLVFATQTEMIIGSNERLSNKAFYDAESAIAVTIARTLTANDQSPYVRTIDRAPELTTGVPVVSVLTSSKVVPISAPWCSLCQINNTGTYNGDAFFNVSYVFTVRSLLMAPNGTTLASKRISDNVATHPWPHRGEAIEFEVSDEMKIEGGPLDGHEVARELPQT